MLRELFDHLVRMLTWVVIVAPWEQALRVRLGNRVTLLGPGIHLRVPCVDRVYRQPIRRRRCVIPPQTLTTCDAQTISLSGSLSYSIVDLRCLYETLHQPQETIEMEAAAVVASYVTSHSLVDCAPEKLEAYVTQRLELERFGLGQVEFQICCFAVVRTYRLISGNFKDWQSEQISTTKEEGTVE